MPDFKINQLPKPEQSIGYQIINGKRVWAKRIFTGQWRKIRSPQLIKELDEKYPLNLVK